MPRIALKLAPVISTVAIPNQHSPRRLGTSATENKESRGSKKKLYTIFFWLRPPPKALPSTTNQALRKPQEDHETNGQQVAFWLVVYHREVVEILCVRYFFSTRVGVKTDWRKG